MDTTKDTANGGETELLFMHCLIRLCI